VNVAGVEVGGKDGLVLLGPRARQKLFQRTLALANVSVDQNTALIALHFKKDVLADRDFLRIARRLSGLGLLLFLRPVFRRAPGQGHQA
jgi:hypothetical protein